MATKQKSFVRTGWSGQNNPFKDAFWAKQLKFLNVQKERKAGDARIYLAQQPPLRCDDYFNKNFRSKSPAPVPTLQVNGEHWMSLTAMEVQASELSIRCAHGVVWTAGLGLGYFPLRCAAKRSVKEVHVVERSPSVIALFFAMHGHRPEIKKIQVYSGDAREIIRKKTGDYCWMDTYQSLCSDDVIEDGKWYRKKNQFTEYCFWGWELTMLWCLQFKILRGYQLPNYLLGYIITWKDTPLFQGRGRTPEQYKGVRLENLMKEPMDKPWCRKALNNAIDIKYS